MDENPATVERNTEYGSDWYMYCGKCGQTGPDGDYADAERDRDAHVCTEPVWEES